jgi:hypothetical protein
MLAVALMMMLTVTTIFIILGDTTVMKNLEKGTVMSYCVPVGSCGGGTSRMKYVVQVLG